MDSEPIHLMAFRRVLKGVGVELTREAYYGKYLGYDDHDCFAAAMRDNGLTCSETQIAEMTATKTVIVQQEFAESILPLDGAVALIRDADDAGVPVAVCSGALRGEIELASKSIGVLESFASIVAAEDVEHGKPHPEGYQLALSRLIEATGRDLKARRCVAIDDSPAGIEAAKAAGLQVLAVTSSYPPTRLQAADRVVGSLIGVDISVLDELL